MTNQTGELLDRSGLLFLSLEKRLLTLDRAESIECNRTLFFLSLLRGRPHADRLGAEEKCLVATSGGTRIYIYARLVNLAIEREQEEKEEQTRSDRMDLSYIYDIYIYIRTVPSKWVNA